MSAKEMVERSRLNRENQVAEVIKLIKTSIGQQVDLGERSCVLAFRNPGDRTVTVHIPNCPAIFGNSLKGSDDTCIFFSNTEGGRSIKSHFENEGYTFSSYYDASGTVHLAINW